MGHAGRCALIATSCMLATSGCSFATTRAPRPPPGSPDCRTSEFAPASDAAMVVLAPIGGLIGGVLIALRDLGSDRDSDDIAGAVMISGLVIGGVSVSSFVYGMVNTSRCRRAYRERGITPPDELD